MQLDLFLHPQRPSAIIFAFPLARRDKLIRATACHLLGTSKAAGRAFWRAHVSALRQDLKAHGVPMPAIDREISSYTDAVSREMYIHLANRSGPSGGTA